MRLAGQAKGGFYLTPERVVDLIADLVGAPTGYHHRNQDILRILDPCCGAGEAVARLGERIGYRERMPVETYGVELHRERAQEAEERLHRTLTSDLFRTSIANGAFGVHDEEERRVEHSFLTHCTRYLDEEGVLVFIVPRRRLHVSARYLASHYGRMRCWAFPHPEVEDYDQVALLGVRKTEPAYDASAEAQVRAWAEGELEVLPLARHLLYTAPVTPQGEVLFATRTVDPVAAATEARRFGLWVSPEVTDSLWPLGSERTRPLMPLRRGHMAMLVAAGFLDNWCWRPTDTAFWSRGAPPRNWCWWRRRSGLRCTGNASIPPWWPSIWTTARSPTSPPRQTQPR